MNFYACRPSSREGVCPCRQNYDRSAPVRSKEDSGAVFREKGCNERNLSRHDQNRTARADRIEERPAVRKTDPGGRKGYSDQITDPSAWDQSPPGKRRSRAGQTDCGIGWGLKPEGSHLSSDLQRDRLPRIDAPQTIIRIETALMRVIFSPRKSPISVTTTMLPPMMMGPPMDICTPCL